MKTEQFNLVSFLLRFVFALLLVFFTYNPSGFSWVNYIMNDAALVYKAATGMVLLIGWVIYLRATWNSLGPIGTVLAAAVFAILIWLLVEWGLLSLKSASAVEWVLLLILSWVLAVGMSWSHIRRRMSGQYDTDEIEG